MIGLYFFGQVLVLLKTCYSQCFDVFDPKTLLVSNFKNSSLPGFNLWRNADIAMCMMVCYKFKLCRSVDWADDKKVCRLNTRFDIKNDLSLTTKGPTFNIHREIFPTRFVGICLNHSCTEDEICIAGKCVPVLEEKIYKDCSDIVKRDPSKKGQDGVYVIYPDIRRDVYCEMTTDGGGWTVIQKREDGDVDFYRTWIEYKQGFGNASKNYWIGNDAIHTLTRDKNQELRVNLQRHNGEQAYAMYTTFYIGDEDSKYRLTVSRYSGTAGDSLDVHNGMKFSTKDQDNDAWDRVNCATQYLGAWWYNNCFNSNLNAEYGQAGVSGGIYPVWKSWPWRKQEALQKTALMIKHRT